MAVELKQFRVFSPILPIAGIKYVIIRENSDGEMFIDGESAADSPEEALEKSNFNYHAIDKDQLELWPVVGFSAIVLDEGIAALDRKGVVASKERDRRTGTFVSVPQRDHYSISH